MDINQSVTFEIIKIISVFGGDEKLTFKTSQITNGQRRNVYDVVVEKCGRIARSRPRLNVKLKFLSYKYSDFTLKYLLKQSNHVRI